MARGTSRCTGSSLDSSLVWEGSWRPERDPVGSIIPPIYLSAIYKYPDEDKAVKPVVGDLKYSRENNPTVLLLEESYSCLEGGKWALAFNSGMAALASVMLAHVTPKSRVTIARLVYGATRSLLASLWKRIRFDYNVSGPPWEDLLDAAEYSDIILVETIANPTLRIPPLHELLKACRDTCRVIVDNTFASPILFRPLEMGAWLVVESSTKYLSGHNDVAGGLVAGQDMDDYKRIWEWRRLLGTAQQPLDAYLVLRGLKTLHLRVERASRSALEIAKWLERHPKVSKVYYPGLPSHPDHDYAKKLFNGIYGGVVTFELSNGDPIRFLSRLRIIAPAPSLGGGETLATLPYYSSHRGLPEEEKARLGITPRLVRLSIGLESVEDLINDLNEALRHG